MKKVVSFALLSFLVIIGMVIGGGSTVLADEANQPKPLTPEQLEEMNEALDKLKNQANEKLDNGEENFSVSTNVSFQEEPIVMEFGFDEPVAPFGSTLASQKKSFSHTVKNTAGFNFSHRVFGSFVYSSGKVTGYTADSDLSGPLYGKTHSTFGDRLDPSVVVIRSTGTFKALKYFPVEYKTRIDIGLYGSGNYRVLTASIS